MPAFTVNLALIFAFILAPSTLCKCNGLMKNLKGETDPIILTCRKVTDFGVCVITLRSDPRSHGASVDGLAHIALDRLGAHTKHALDNLHKLQKSVAATEKTVVDTCIHFYDLAMNGDVPAAVKNLNNKAYGDAKKAALAAMNDGKQCEQMISKHPSEMWQSQKISNTYMHDLSLLSSDLIGLLN